MNVIGITVTVPAITVDVIGITVNVSVITVIGWLSQSTLRPSQ